MRHTASNAHHAVCKAQHATVFGAGCRARATHKATTMPSRNPRGETTRIGILMQRMGMHGIRGLNIRGSCEQERTVRGSTCPAGPCVWTKRFAPFLGRAAPGARLGRSSKDREVGLIRKGKDLAPAAQAAAAGAPIRLAANELPLSRQSDAANVAWGVQRWSGTAQPSVRKPQWTRCGRRPRTPFGCWRSLVCSSVCLWPVLCNSSAADSPPAARQPIFAVVVVPMGRKWLLLLACSSLSAGRTAEGSCPTSSHFLHATRRALGADRTTLLRASPSSALRRSSFSREATLSTHLPEG
jgi:hypothetical protein